MRSEAADGLRASGGGFEERIGVFVAGSTAAEEDELVAAYVSDRMPSAGGNRDRVTRAHGVGFVTERHRAGAGEDVVDLLDDGVVVRDRGTAWGKTCLRKALVADRGVAMGEQFANGGAIDGREGNRVAVVDDIHDLQPNQESAQTDGRSPLHPENTRRP